MEKKLLFEAAEKATQWMIRNQVSDRLDANRGRCLCHYNPKSKAFQMTASWETGCVCMDMLAMYKRTGEQVYLDRAELAGRYIMGLQVMDQRQERYYGVLRELTPQSLEFCPRDATTGAWGLVWLYNATKNPEYLDRAVLFGNWHMKYGMHEGWPLYAQFMTDEMEDYYAKGSFQSGTGLFYHDLFRASGDIRYIQHGMKPIAENYRDNFFFDNGRVIQERDVFTNEITSASKQSGVVAEMHEYNDDFGNAMLQMASDLFKDESFREQARKYAHWLAEQQDEDGGYQNGEAPSGVPDSMIYFHDLGTYYNDDVLLKARDKALAKLLSTQFENTGDPKLDGAFRGAYTGPKDIPGAADVNINIRTTQYAIIALLKIESDLSDIWLGRHNEPFIDAVRKENYMFKW